MKRRIIALIAALMLILSAAALASDYQYDLVVDYSGLLSESEYEELNAKAWRISDEYDMDVGILTADSTEGKGDRDYSDDFYDYNGYGRGADRSGLMLCVYMAERRIYITTRGEGIRDFTDYGYNTILDEIADDMTAGNYYRAFDLYLDLAETFIHEARENQPYDTNHTYNGVPLSAGQKIAGGAGIGGVLGLLASLLGVGGMRRSMHTARPKRDAGMYVRKGSMNVTRLQDIFLFSSVHRERIESSSSGGGGSSTHTSSSGATHGGGGRGF